MKPILTIALFLLAPPLNAGSAAQAQMPLNPLSLPAANPLNNPTLSPGVAFLFNLERKFAAETAAGGGKAFSSWFADDALTLSNGKAAVVGRAAIAAQATWDPKQYQLTWTPEGGEMGAAGDMGFTWGHYEGTSRDQNGNPVKTEGRYMTIWKKLPDGSWKVKLDSSNDEPPNSGDCCKVQ